MKHQLIFALFDSGQMKNNNGPSLLSIDLLKKNFKTRTKEIFLAKKGRERKERKGKERRTIKKEPKVKKTKKRKSFRKVGKTKERNREKG